MRYPEHLLKLIQALKKLPGVGHKSAERFAFQLLKWPASHLHELGRMIAETQEKIQACMECGCLMDHKACFFCDPLKRDPNLLCVIASARDAFFIEDTHEYRGLYHVLGGVLSPIESKGPEQLDLYKLKNRIVYHQVKEVVIALDSTLEGDATALFLKQELASHQVHVSRLAFGLPMGSSLDYVDGGTLARALSGRHRF